MYGVFYKWGIPNSWMVHYFMENPSINGWFGGILGNLLIQKYFICPNGGIYIIICVYNNICCRIMVSTSRDCLDVGQKSGTLVNIGSGFHPSWNNQASGILRSWAPPHFTDAHVCTCVRLIYLLYTALLRSAERIGSPYFHGLGLSSEPHGLRIMGQTVVGPKRRTAFCDASRNAVSTADAPQRGQTEFTFCRLPCSYRKSINIRL